MERYYKFTQFLKLHIPPILLIRGFKMALLPLSALKADLET
jgi:hypothetical protein